jgi:hypothetical protein
MNHQRQHHQVRILNIVLFILKNFRHIKRKKIKEKERKMKQKKPIQEKGVKKINQEINHGEINRQKKGGKINQVLIDV